MTITWSNRLSAVQVGNRLASSRRLTEAERDAVAWLVDRVSTLASEVDGLRTIEDEYDSRLTAMRVALTEAGIPDGNSERVFGGVERIEMLAKERDTLKAREALDAAADAVKTSERLRTLEARVKALVADADTLLESRPVHQDVTRLVDAAGRWCVSSPIHPALVRLAEAATVYLRSDATTMSADLNSLSSAVDALPSPLPTVVTCGECEFAESCLWSSHLSTCRDGWCSRGKRREG